VSHPARCTSTLDLVGCPTSVHRPMGRLVLACQGTTAQASSSPHTSPTAAPCHASMPEGRLLHLYASRHWVGRTFRSRYLINLGQHSGADRA
jgi:hypothetical protein